MLLPVFKFTEVGSLTACQIDALSLIVNDFPSLNKQSAAQLLRKGIHGAINSLFRDAEGMDGGNKT